MLVSISQIPAAPGFHRIIYNKFPEKSKIYEGKIIWLSEGWICPGKQGAAQYKTNN